MKRFLKILALVLAVLVLLTALAPPILSTGPGRWLAECYLSARLQRQVTMASLDVGYTSGISVEQLVIAERPGFGDRPFVKVAALNLPNSLYTLLWGDAPLDELTVTGPEISIVHSAAKELSIADLLKDESAKTAEKKEPSARQTPAKPLPWRLPVRIEAAQFRYTDKVLSTAATIEDFNLTGLYDCGLFTADKGEGRLNDGWFTVAGTVDFREKPQPFTVTLDVKDARAAGDLWGLGQLVPLLHNPFGKTRGVVTFEAKLAGAGFKQADLAANLAGDTHLVVRDLVIEGSEVAKQYVAKYGQLLGISHNTLTLDELVATSRIAGGRITSDDIHAAHGTDYTLRMKGETVFGGPIKYELTVTGKKLEKYHLDHLTVPIGGTLSKPKVDIPDTLINLFEGLLDGTTKKPKK